MLFMMVVSLYTSRVILNALGVEDNIKLNLFMAQSDKFKRVKPDITPYLFHFTKGENAKEKLDKILCEERLYSSSHDYICFTASPLTSLFEFFNTKVNRTGLPMYQPFGIGFSRNIMYKQFGARNVIYGTQKELEILKSTCPDIAWRCEELDIVRHDFEYLREWRIQGKEFKFDKFDKNELIVIADTKENLLNLVEGRDLDIDFEEFEPGECFPTIIECKTGKRAFKGIVSSHFRTSCVR